MDTREGENRNMASLSSSNYCYIDQIHDTFAHTSQDIFNSATGMENMITYPPSNGASSSKAGFYHFISENTDESMLPVPQDHNAYVDNPSLRCVFPCEGNEKPSQDLSLSLSSAIPSAIGLQSFELRHPWEQGSFQKSTDQIQQNNHDHHNMVLQEGYFRKSTYYTPYSKGKLLAMLQKVFFALLLTFCVALAEITPNGTANGPDLGKDKTDKGGHHKLSDLEKTVIILGVLVGCFIVIVSALYIYIRWAKHLPKLGIRQIESFPLVRFPPEEGTVGYGISACEICLEDFTDGVDLRLLSSCGHMFHTDCALTWLHKYHAICPVCRYNYSITV